MNSILLWNRLAIWKCFNFFFLREVEKEKKKEKIENIFLVLPTYHAIIQNKVFFLHFRGEEVNVTSLAPMQLGLIESADVEKCAGRTWNPISPLDLQL